MATHNTYPKGITLKASGTYSVAVMVKGVRKSGTASTLAEAVDLREALIVAIKTGKEVPKFYSRARQAWTLAEAAQETYKRVWSKLKGNRSVVYAKGIAKYFGPKIRIDEIWGDSLVEDGRADVSMVDDFCTYCSEDRGNSGSTINRKLSALSVMVATALEYGKGGALKSVPKMPRWPEGEHRVRYLSYDEEDLILGHMQNLGKIDHKEATVLLIETGLRPSELWNLEARDVDMSFDDGRGALTVWYSKTNRARTVPLTLRTRQIIKNRMAAYPTGKLFPDMNQDRYRHVWDRVKSIMGLGDDEQFIPYVCRHTCCSRLVQKGNELVHVKEWMGHSVIATTTRYAHLAPQSLIKASLEDRTTPQWSANLRPKATYDD